MQNLTPNQRFLADVANDTHDSNNPSNCAMMRATGVRTTKFNGQDSYFEAARAKYGFSADEVAGIALGWDEVARPNHPITEAERAVFACNYRYSDPEALNGLALGRAAARACGFGSTAPSPVVRDLVVDLGAAVPA